jgi:hypothetical protein
VAAGLFVPYAAWVAFASVLERLNLHVELASQCGPGPIRGRTSGLLKAP